MNLQTPFPVPLPAEEVELLLEVKQHVNEAAAHVLRRILLQRDSLKAKVLQLEHMLRDLDTRTTGRR